MIAGVVVDQPDHTVEVIADVAHDHHDPYIPYKYIGRDLSRSLADSSLDHPVINLSIQLTNYSIE
jgi:hypothetical protein